MINHLMSEAAICPHKYYIKPLHHSILLNLTEGKKDEIGKVKHERNKEKQNLCPSVDQTDEPLHVPLVLEEGRAHLGPSAHVEHVDGDVNRDDADNVDNVEREPDVDVEKVGRLWELAVDRPHDGRDDEEGGEGAHEPVAEVVDVDKEGQVGEEPEEEALEKRREKMARVDSLKDDDVREPCLLLRQVVPGRDALDGELCEGHLSVVGDGGLVGR